MLEVAREKPNGALVEWVQGTAENYRSAKRFDLIIMTGNAFQALSDDAAVAAACANMAQHLATDGEIVFESRNPAIDWEAHLNGEKVVQLGDETVTETHQLLHFDGTHMQFDTHYQFADRTMVSRSDLLFLSREAIQMRLEQAGLAVATVMGDWDGADFDPASAAEMVFVAKHRA